MGGVLARWHGQKLESRAGDGFTPTFPDQSLGLDLAQCGSQSLNRQMAGMGGSFWQAANGFDDILPVQLPRSFQRRPGHQFRHRRTTSNRCDAPFRKKPNLRDAAVRDFQSELQNVTTGGILELNSGVGIFDFSRISRALEMVEKLIRIHVDNSNGLRGA